MQDAGFRRLALLTGAFLVVRLASASIVAQPGYTDAYYYADVAGRVARGLGLSADFVWNPLELGALPVVSHKFWMPLASVLQAIGIAAVGQLLGDFRAAQAAVILIAALVPAATYACVRALGAAERAALVGAVVVGLGGLFSPAWVSVDGFALAALFGALFFLAYRTALAGSLRAGLVAGALVGLLYLTRAEAALFGLALVALALRAQSRRAGIGGALVALLIGGAWLARDASVGIPSDLFARAALLVRYEDFFAIRSPTLDAFLASFGDALAAKGGALVSNALTFGFAFSLLLVVPLAAGLRSLWSRLEVRAWAILAVLVFAAQSLVWTLHSTRGSYFHSLGAFFPFGVAIAMTGGERLLASRRSDLASAWTAGALLLVAASSAGALAQWDATFNGGTRVRAAAVDAIPAGPFLAIDAAAWRWLSGHPVLVTPADGLDAAACLVVGADAHSLVLEEAHFRAYDELYRGGTPPAWLGAPIERGPVKIYPVIGAADLWCSSSP